MTLRGLLAGVEVVAVRGSLDREVRGVAYDSRRVRSGDAFFALGGTHHHGATFASQAVGAGASAVIGAGGTLTLESAAAVTCVEVSEPRVALALAARTLHGDPARQLALVAVTGTNGKTTTTYMLASIFAAAGLEPGVIGTTGIWFAGERRPSALTTPEAPELYGVLAEMLGRGVRAVALELSSHALHQRRAFGLDADVVVFTNLTHDHLDYHGTLEAYLDAKLMLFDGRNRDRAVKPWAAVVNLDDPAAARVMDAARECGAAVWSYGESQAATVRIASIAARAGGLGVAIAHQGATAVLELPMLGRFNAWNAAAAFATGLALGLPHAAIVRGLEAVRGVPGRLERVDRGQGFQVVVDFAHTPDALERALAAAREHTHGRVLLVFGCGGDRDRAKRPGMGRVAARDADRVWVTSDNPRNEDPAAIAAEVMRGVAVSGRVAPMVVELDRRRAIGEAIALAEAGDLVLIAGKGHETTQVIGDRVLPFDDRVVARETLDARANPGGGR